MKVRIRSSKLGKVRFVGNLDVTRIWERALRKCSLPVAYSTGFSPRPKLSFGLALPMAAESVAEYLDVELSVDVALEGLAEQLSAALPAGFDVLAVATKEAGQVSLQEDVVSCDWVIGLRGIDADDARRAVETVLAADALPLERERKGERRTDDVRPVIERLGVGADDGGVVLQASLATTGRGLRPTELVTVLFPHTADDVYTAVRRVLRTEQWIERDGARRELLPLPAAVAAPAELAGA